jgi:hypothetical protein
LGYTASRDKANLAQPGVAHPSKSEPWCIDVEHPLVETWTEKTMDQWIGFSGKSTPESPMIFMGKSMVSGRDFPQKTNPKDHGFLAGTWPRASATSWRSGGWAFFTPKQKGHGLTQIRWCNTRINGFFVD